MPEKSKCNHCNKGSYKMVNGLCIHCYERLRYQSLKVKKHLYYLANKEKWLNRNRKRYFKKRNTEYSEVRRYTKAKIDSLKPKTTKYDPFSIISQIESLGLQDLI